MVRRIGAGGLGVVYEVLDREHQRRIALKTLRRLDADARLRLKYEFRALQDIHHPNLIGLGELHEDEGQLFFTMELIRGVDFLVYVQDHEDGGATDGDERGAGPTTQGTAREHEPLRTIPPSSVGPSSRWHSRRAIQVHQGRLRSALAQLVEAIAALHAAGKVHRDIKPSNVLVTAAGRVVLLDFGMIADSDGPAMDASIVGTEQYMAPEQAAGLPAGFEADWYSVGVVLYQALTGAYPFQVAPFMVMELKQRSEPEPPSTLVSGLPEDLVSLCMELLRIDPAARPTAGEVLRRLGRTQASAESIIPSRRGAVFVGRTEELEILTEALAEAGRGRALAVLIEGESGIGKTSLMRRFLDRITAEADVLVGRCYERDAVPYKAVDEVIDALSRTLAKLGKQDVEALLPERAELLGELFPVLAPVLKVGEEPTSSEPGEAMVAPREEAFAALREILRRLRQRGRIVIAIDDLQWADADGLALLSDLLRPPGEPALLFVATLRTGTGASSIELLERLAWPREAVWKVELGRLPGTESRELLRQLLAGASSGEERAMEATLREADGHPLFLDMLAREHLARGERRGTTRLRDLLWERIEVLAPEARELLDLLVIAGSPVPVGAARQAVRMDGPGFARHFAALRDAGLVRTRGAGEHQYLEIYHDRIGEIAQRGISAETKRDLHGRLAHALERSADTEADALAAHWREAGETERAFAHTAHAGDRAARVGDFERASALYREALALEETVPRRAGEDPTARATLRRTLQVHLGDALGHIGRSAAAAAVYLGALDGATPPEAMDIRRRAVEAHLRAGSVDEGLRVAEPLFVSLVIAAHQGSAAAQMLLRRAQSQLHELHYEERSLQESSPEALQRIDLCWSLATGLAFVDPGAGALFRSQSLLFSLDAGEPSRIVRAVALEASHVAAGGGPASERAAALLAESDRLARRLGNPHATSRVLLAQGVSAGFQGRWRASLTALDRAAEMLTERSLEARWERGVARYFSVWSLWFLGDLGEFSRRVLSSLHDEGEQDDRYLASLLRTSQANAFWLLRGDPDAAVREADVAIARWARTGRQLQPCFDLLARAHIFLYRGEGQAAAQLFDDRWPELERSLVSRIQVVRLYLAFVRGGALLAAARASADPLSRLSEVLGAASRIEGEGMPWATPLAAMLRAGAAAVRGEREEALSLLDRAATQLDAADMSLYAAAARFRVGALGDAATLAQTTQWMRQHGVADPARLTAMLAPGFPD
ncbi:Hypothetical protein CAP_7411 [Chondromyces apiculatus DSM 436]|uniref:non-specific serine/threonine protein kinase n=1 Tax=Chondromyces apiculatus DSM 436 TaxID=1192034 RepID=A0A017T013_9BACT|nr:Hypothetical protein CAP_7411 [Chondromyces apiculatus DSM 436]